MTLTWEQIAHQWLNDSALPDRLIDRYTPRLAQILHDAAEQFVDSDIPEAESERDQAAYDDHIHRKIDEARGK